MYNSPTGGQFYYAFNTIKSLFSQLNMCTYIDLIVGLYYDNEDESILNQYLNTDYYHIENIIYPNNSRINKNLKWDFIHLLTEDMLYQDFFNSKILFHIHGLQDWVLHKEKIQKTKYIRHLFVKYYSRLAYKYIVPSTNLKNELIFHYRFSEKKIDIIPNGFDANIFKSILKKDAVEYLKTNYNLQINKPLLLHASDLSYKKNFETILKYFELLIKEKDAMLIVAGGRNRELISYYSRLVKNMGIEQNVCFIGKVKQNDLNYFYNASDLFIFPSRSESFGMPALEAMACGCQEIVINKTAGFHL